MSPEEYRAEEGWKDWKAQEKRIRDLETRLRMCAGLLSATEGYTHRHPQDVYEEIMAWKPVEGE